MRVSDRIRVIGERREYLRFTTSQRLQHVFMFVPFTVLVVTGFPIKFPDSSFWTWVVDVFGGIGNIRSLHRIAAVVMIVDFCFHVVYMLFNIVRNRTRVKDMHLLPDRQDLRDIRDNLRHFLFLTDERPRFRRFSYLEKFDYWAVFWGMFIMAGSGLILWHPEEAGRWLPASAIQIAYVAHSDEALLAFLAIVIWHFYNVHFNPRVWPANKVWYKGALSEERMREEHPRELEEILEQLKRGRQRRHDDVGDGQGPQDGRDGGA
ncbi:MAG: cytochrome b/b6 domain-containing protein [bacterium]|jgi:cytochrome b subunit of formate dehydrogenase|nr:cytochrome b/b6 domain-containing protein [bacterium]